MRTIVLALATVASFGCQPQVVEENHEPAEVPTSAATIPVETVSGNILGKPFALATARYTVDRRPHYEKIEIQLLQAKPEKACDHIGTNHDPAVWLRRTGSTELKPETVRFGPKDTTPWEAHYEIFENEDWRGNGASSVILELSAPAPDMKLAGELYACFGDRTQSCVSGRFVAVYCPIQIDALVRGTESMERPPPRTGRAVKSAADSHVLPGNDRPPGAPPQSPTSAD